MIDRVEAFEYWLGWALAVAGGLGVAGLLAYAVQDAWRHWWRAPWERAVRLLRGVFLRGGLWR